LQEISLFFLQADVELPLGSECGLSAQVRAGLQGISPIFLQVAVGAAEGGGTDSPDCQPHA